MKLGIAGHPLMPADLPWPLTAVLLESASVVAVAVAVHDRCVVRAARMTARRAKR